MTIFHIPTDEVELTAVRSQGPGGQNVNKVSSAIQLRFDVGASSLPPELKERVLALRDHRLTKGGVVVIKSQEHRSQDMNRMAALLRLHDLLELASLVQKPRKPTRPTRSSQVKRVESKVKRGQTKALRGKGPLSLLITAPVGNRSMAQRVEARIKRLPKSQKETLVGMPAMMQELIDNVIQDIAMPEQGQTHEDKSAE